MNKNLNDEISKLKYLTGILQELKYLVIILFLFLLIYQLSEISKKLDPIMDNACIRPY